MKNTIPIEEHFINSVLNKMGNVRLAHIVQVNKELRRDYTLNKINSIMIPSTMTITHHMWIESVTKEVEMRAIKKFIKTRLAEIDTVLLLDILDDYRDKEGVFFQKDERMDYANETYIPQEITISYKNWIEAVRKEVLVRQPSNTTCFAGNDVDLLYWEECLECNTVFVVDHSKEESCQAKFQYCPTCYPIKDYPFECYTLKEQQNSKEIRDRISFYRGMGLI